MRRLELSLDTFPLCVGKALALEIGERTAVRALFKCYA